MHRSISFYFPNTFKRTILFLHFSFFILHPSLSTQTLSYQTPADLFVCDSAPFEITVSNTSNATLQGITVEVNFTTNNGTDCGLAYLPNTVSGASEGAIADLGMPVFELTDLAAGASATFTFQVEAPCLLYTSPSPRD